MQQNINIVNIKYILITNSISFIPDAILNCCETIHMARPSKTIYNKCLKCKLPTDIKLNSINNIKGISIQLIEPHKFICNKIIDAMININELKMLKFRDLVYDIFIYNLNISDCIWYILNSLNEQNKIEATDLSLILIKTFLFFQYYNNNYRPIYHLEQYLYYIISVIHNY